MLKLRERRSASERAGLVRIAVEVPKNGLSALKHPQPATGLQAKFSGHYCAAAAWVDGRLDLASFADAAILRADLQHQMNQTTLTERSTEGESLESAPVQVVLKGEGGTDRITVDWAPGSAADPMTREQLRRKWLDCTTHSGMEPDDARALPLLDARLETPAPDVLRPLRESLMNATLESRP